MTGLEALRRRWTAVASRARGVRSPRARGVPAKLGDLRRTSPLNLDWGRGRGRPLDRIYIERFLERHRADIRGRALEAENDRYLRAFGSDLERVDIVDVSEGNSRASVVADLQNAPQISEGSFDCIVLTQVLQYVFDQEAAYRTIHRILAPRGVLLATVPGITRISSTESELYGDWWRFTAQSARRLAAGAFGDANVEVETYGNVLIAAAFLYGLGSDDLRPEELDERDPMFEVIVAIRAIKRS